MSITPEQGIALAKEHGLSADEYQRVLAIVGRRRDSVYRPVDRP